MSVEQIRSKSDRVKQSQARYDWFPDRSIQLHVRNLNQTRDPKHSDFAVNSPITGHRWLDRWMTIFVRLLEYPLYKEFIVLHHCSTLNFSLIQNNMFLQLICAYKTIVVVVLSLVLYSVLIQRFSYIFVAFTISKLSIFFLFLNTTTSCPKGNVSLPFSSPTPRLFVYSFAFFH